MYITRKREVAIPATMNSTDCNITESTKNCTLRASIGPENSQLPLLTSSSIIRISIFCLVFVIGTPGNSYVIYKFAFTKKKSYAGANFVVALALVDLISSFVLPIHNIYLILVGSVWNFGKFLCYIANNLPAILIGASSWSLVALALVRWRLVLVLVHIYQL